MPKKSPLLSLEYHIFVNGLVLVVEGRQGYPGNPPLYSHYRLPAGDWGWVPGIAMDILAHHLGDAQLAMPYIVEFVAEFIATLPRDRTAILRRKEIEKWLTKHNEQDGSGTGSAPPLTPSGDLQPRSMELTRKRSTS